MTSNGAPEKETAKAPEKESEALQCMGRTAKGERCKNKALEGKNYCALHEPKDTERCPGMVEGPEEWSTETVKSLKEVVKLIRRRRHGKYEVDDLGLDMDLLEQLRPVARWFYYKYWRVKATGVENVPAEGRALLVANHSGVLPFDGAMVIMAVQEEHPEPRLVRALVLSLFFGVPFTAPMLSKTGQVQANPSNAERLLRNDELALVFPEGVKGIGKPWRRRYQLARFGRGGFVRIALKSNAPIIPVSIVGAEEIYPNIYNFKLLASILGVPYVPITPFFPLLGPLGLIPLPSKWYIHFSEPIQIPEMTYRRSEEPLLVSKISNQVRDTIQRCIYERLKTRRNVFF